MGWLLGSYVLCGWMRILPFRAPGLGYVSMWLLLAETVDSPAKVGGFSLSASGSKHLIRHHNVLLLSV